MTLDQIPSGARVFIDSNMLVYHFQPHPIFGPVCNRFIQRIERHDVEGYTSSAILAEVAHRLMVIEASALPGWSGGKVTNRLQQNPAVVQQLQLFQTAVDAVLGSKIQAFGVPGALVSVAAKLSRKYALLTNDALALASMQQESITHLASHDSDFDRVPGIVTGRVKTRHRGARQNRQVNGCGLT